ncbi:MAG: prenyltransferase/squalene oxidase repeat-containing protein [Methanosarcinaceae archaeon]
MNNNTVRAAFDWIESQQPDSAKELSHMVTACALWNVTGHYAAHLISMKQDVAWNNSVRETARACSALTNIGIMPSYSKQWIIDHQHDGSWNKDVYDTAYALAALAGMNKPCKSACSWLVNNYCAKWEHVGTTALIINALWKQNALFDSVLYQDFINERAEWILSQRGADGGWKFISTSNIIMQVLMLVGFKDKMGASVLWLLGEMNDNGSWGKGNGNVTATALSLITVGMWMRENK